MTLADIVEAVYLSCADTVVAQAFRRAVGCPGPRIGGRASAKLDSYAGMRECFENRKRVLL